MALFHLSPLEAFFWLFHSPIFALAQGVGVWRLHGPNRPSLAGLGEDGLEQKVGPIPG